jgi:hypothetical protein
LNFQGLRNLPSRADFCPFTTKYKGDDMNEYRTVGNRCAVDLALLQLPISKKEALLLLYEQGFRQVDFDLVLAARTTVGSSRYRRGARLREAPDVFDCSSMVKWLYGQRGIWLPRRSIQQRELGEPVDPCGLVAGDVVFVSGWIDYYHDDPADGVGHVGVYAGDGTVIHAANKRVGVVESPLGEFIAQNRFRGARRYVPVDREVVTLEIPAEREVETSDDFRWIVLQSM